MATDEVKAFQYGVLVKSLAQQYIWNDEITDEDDWEQLTEDTNIAYWNEDGGRRLMFDGYEQEAVEILEHLVRSARKMVRELEDE